jgi:hypothetical protein
LIQIDITKTTENFELILYNSVGELLHSEKLKTAQHFSYQLPEIDGLYFVQLIGSKGSATALKVVKE